MPITLAEQRDLLRDRLEIAKAVGLTSAVVEVDFLLFSASKKALAILNAALAERAAALDLKYQYGATIESGAGHKPRPSAPLRQPHLPLGATGGLAITPPNAKPARMRPRVPPGPDADDLLITF
ncbi:MAG: hypothetical protein K2Z25_19320 [Beijerinckiaceae bacterium]|nr:hypothetical protein [Beijerinckiaceae bacterium]